ncbi:hypothetical protein BaRGS_00039100 [Batillaria attramentaria]|uniref:Uncharacterized protein n=1 Tax=Batillaria attramentaria TaxID=370345 RepID=A0ABD0J4X1_9CAEN
MYATVVANPYFCVAKLHSALPNAVLQLHAARLAWATDALCTFRVSLLLKDYSPCNLMTRKLSILHDVKGGNIGEVLNTRQARAVRSTFHIFQKILAQSRGMCGKNKPKPQQLTFGSQNTYTDTASTEGSRRTKLRETGAWLIALPTTRPRGQYESTRQQASTLPRVSHKFDP